MEEERSMEKEHSMEEEKKAMKKRSTHCPLPEKAAIP